jgi:hypothetical protein
MRNRIGLALLASALACIAPALGGGRIEPKLIYQDGILRVIQRTDSYNEKTREHPYYYLMKTDTHFGLQFLKPKNPDDVGKPDKDFSLRPTCYHHERSPVGIVMSTLKGKTAPPFAVVGMHIGAMAAYAKPGQEVDFFESNPKVIALSLPKKGEPYFTFLQDARKRGAKVRVFPGQQRETLAEKAPQKHYQVIVVEVELRDRLDDVYVELMTREGMALLLDKLADTGILCYHISNRYFEMTPVLADVAGVLGLAVRHSFDRAPDSVLDSPEHFQSEWVMVARKKDQLSKLPPPNYQELLEEASRRGPHLMAAINKPFWDEPPSTRKHVWTDKTPHYVKGILRADPAVSRLHPLFGHFTSKAFDYYGKKGDQKMIAALANLSNQYSNMVNSVSRAAARLRGEFDWTVEDLQQGWPQRQ